MRGGTKCGFCCVDAVKYEILCLVKTLQPIAALSALLASFASHAEEPAHFAATGLVAQVCGGSPARFHLLNQYQPGRYSFGPHSFWLDAGCPTPKSGDIVQLRGVVEKPHGSILDEFPSSSAFIVKDISVAGRGEFPDCDVVSAGDVNGGKYHERFVRISGVVSSVMRDEMNSLWNWFVLRTRDGNVYVAAPDVEHPFDELLALTDAEVGVYGLVIMQTRWRRFAGHYVLPIGERGVVAAKPPPAEAGALGKNVFDVNSFSQLASRGDLLHRVKMDGVLIAASSRYCFMQTEAEIVKLVMMPRAALPECGTRVSAAGFVSMDFSGLTMSDVVMTSQDAHGDPPAPVAPTDIHKLYLEAKNPGIYSPAKLRRVVTVDGVVANTLENIRSSRRMRIERGGYATGIDVSGMPDGDLSHVSLGATVRVTGVCNAEFEADPSIATFPRFTGFSVIPASSRNIEVLQEPPWWTPQRLLAVIGTLLVTLAWIFAWNRILNRRSERRGRQLYDERVAHIRTEAKVEERTRLAVELHDAISQTLTGVALQVDSAARANGDDGNSTGAFLKTARNMLASCRRELKDCLWDLRSRTFEEKDMTEAIVRTIGPHKGDAAASVRFNVPRERLSESTTHTILSIVRELVVNAIRHGRATHVWIAGEYHDGRITFSVRDNGCGFDVASAPGPLDGHFGLQGVRERVNEAGGTVDIASIPGKGAKINVELRTENP